MAGRTLLTVLLLAAASLLLAGCSQPDSPPASSAAPLTGETSPLASPTPPLAGPTVRLTPGGSPSSAGSSTGSSAGSTAASPTASAANTTLPGPVLRQLTSGGCCVEPFWAPDSQSLLYIDRPSRDAPAGLWRVDLPGGAPQFVTERLGVYSPDLQRRAFLSGGETLVEDLQTGEQWRIPNDGRAVSFSPDGQWLAWTAGQSGPPFDRARREVWISRADGSQAQMVFASPRGGFEGWFPDGRLLVSGAASEDGGSQALWALNLDNSRPDQPDLLELGQAGRLREAKISPGGSWLVYLATFSADPAQDGLWLADTRSGERWLLEHFGGFHWRDDEHLLLVPLDLQQPLHWLVQIEAASRQAVTLTDPLQTPFKIANGDWRVSPDGHKLVFVSAADGNIWLLELGG